MNESSVWNFNPCSYAMLVEAGWYSFRSQDLIGDHGFINDRASRGVPKSDGVSSVGPGLQGVDVYPNHQVLVEANLLLGEARGLREVAGVGLGDAVA